MLMPFSGCFVSCKNQGPLSTVARSHEAGRGEGETQVGSGYGQVPRTALSSDRAAGTLCGTLESGENVHFICVFT